MKRSLQNSGHLSQVESISVDHATRSQMSLFSNICVVCAEK
jgi:hypothetical protein